MVALGGARRDGAGLADLLQESLDRQSCLETAEKSHPDIDSSDGAVDLIPLSIRRTQNDSSRFAEETLS